MLNERTAKVLHGFTAMELPTSSDAPGFARSEHRHTSNAPSAASTYTQHVPVWGRSSMLAEWLEACVTCPLRQRRGISCPGRSARVSACMDKSRGRCGRVQWRGSGWGVARLLDDHRKRDERLLHAVVHLRARLEELHVQVAGQLLPLLVRDNPAPGQVALVPHEQLQATHTHTAGRTAVSR